MTVFRPALLAFAGLVIFGFCWGAGIPLTKIAVSTGHKPIGLIFWQFVFAIMLIGAVLAYKRIPVRLEACHLRYYLIIAFIGTIIPNTFGYLAAVRLPAGIMSLVIATVPMFSLTIALALGNEQLRWLRIAGIVLGVSAMVLVALPEASLPSPDMTPWVAVALIAPVCYGLEGNYVAMRAPSDLNAMAVLWGASLIGLAITGPVAWLTGSWVDLLSPWEAPEWALLGSSVGHAIAYSGYMWLVVFAGVVFTAQISYVVTLTGIAMSMAVLGESYSAWVWLAAAMMLAGLALVQPKARLPEVEA